MAVYRIYVEKREEFAVDAKNLNLELKNVLNIKNLENTRIINVYDVEGIDEETFKTATMSIFSEPLIDNFFFELKNKKNTFAVEYLPGQYDKRADFCEQCLELISFKKRPTVKTKKIYQFIGNLEENDLEKIKNYIINPIESRECSFEKEESLKTNFSIPTEIKIFENFNNLNEEELKEFIKTNNLAMNISDILICQDYFKNKEKRPPTETEIKILDAYWSDHCRHTTFTTKIENEEIKDKDVLETFLEYKKIKKELGEEEKPITLMDIATIGAKKLKKDGLLKNLDESEEINACSVCIPVTTENETKEVLLMFKNETHNHPTEIEPFGGASTCLGGAIRDPLSGRCYVYQAMRITGAANPLTPFEKTLKGKLPQSKIVKTAALGYSSYGNQIGLATGFVEEIYHSGYMAKRMEVGAVLGAVLKENVVRKTPKETDVVLLIGGKTGRDGCGGAAGSSKSHTTNSLSSCGAEVQKGNPVEERKIQRFFLNKDVTKLIKKCNDFGAGGVSVAVGELADGISIDLDKVPKKYEGLTATELAISESQERMAVVVSKEDADYIIKKAKEENLTATKIAEVSKEKRIKMFWQGKKVVDISREFLNLNGAKRKTNVLVEEQKIKEIYNEKNEKENWINHMKKLNICSQKGLVKMFDSTIGARTVLMPYGGEFKNTKAQSMVCLIPIEKNKETVSIMSYGFNPYYQEQSPFLGASFAVVESISKIIAIGGNLKNCYLTFQEYFPSIKNDKKRFGLPFSALLGALKAQLNLKVASIGGKDSMSGSFEDLDVPPSLISFAVCHANLENIISPEFKKTESFVGLITPRYKEKNKIDFSEIKKVFETVENLIASKKVISAYAIGFGGISEAITKMCFGNKIGFEFSEKIEDKMLFNPTYGGFVLELTEKINEIKIIGKTTKSYEIKTSSFKIDLKELEIAYDETLEKIYKTKQEEDRLAPKIQKIEYKNKDTSIKKTNLLIKTPKPKVLIPVFPGTNCEFDLKNQFEEQNAECEIFVINNLNEEEIKNSIKECSKKIKEKNIIALAGGFSASDEPDGSAKFIAAFFKNREIKESLEEFLKEKDGLMLGICNGFQALIKLGLIEYGTIVNSEKINATLTYNTIGLHQSTIVKVKTIKNNSPWLQYETIGETKKIAISHGEGRLIATKEALNKFVENEQISTVYVDNNENETMDNLYNPNGSYYAIEGLTSKDGKIFGRMGHSERMVKGLYKNIPNIKSQTIFKAGVDYFK